MSNPTFAVSIGLLEPYHRSIMGAAVWVYLLLISWQTDPDGAVLHGEPILAQEIATKLGVSVRSVREHLDSLAEPAEVNGEKPKPYITRKRTQRGYVITVLRPKKWFRVTEKRKSQSSRRPAENRNSDRQKSATQNDPRLTENRNSELQKSAVSPLSSVNTPKGESASPNDAPAFALQPPDRNGKLDPFGVLAAIAEAGGLPQPSRPLEKDLGQAKQLLKANPELTAEQVELVVRHLLKVEPGYWNRKQPIDAAAVRKFLPIVLAEETKSTSRPDGYFTGFEAAGGVA